MDGKRRKRRRGDKEERERREQRIRDYFYNEMRYINLRFTYLLTYREVANLIRTGYGETGVMDFGLFCAILSEL